MFIPKSHLSKLFSIALLSATLITTIPVQAKTQSIAKTALKATLNTARAAGIISSAALGYVTGTDPELTPRMRVSVSVNLALFASMLARDIYNDYAHKNTTTNHESCSVSTKK